MATDNWSENVTVTFTDADLYQQFVSLPDQLEKALATPRPALAAYNKACLVGMGNAALAGDVLADYMDAAGGHFLEVVRGNELPAWVDGRTLFLAVSYSGDTGEVLRAYTEARKRGCKVVCITSGGKLERECGEHGDLLLRCPPGLISRGAFGYMVGFTALALEAAGDCAAATELQQLLPRLRAYRERLLGPDAGRIDQICSMLKDNVPVVYSFANMTSAAMRWKIQLNENARLLSFCGSLPEFNHNEIVGWASGEAVSKRFLPVILYDDDASELVRTMIDTSMDMLEQNSIRVVSYHVKGQSILEKILRCVLLGDLVSIELNRRGGDQSTTAPAEGTGRLIITDES